MPNESQAQLAKYFVSSTITTCWVGTPENGGAIRIDTPSGSSTNTRWARNLTYASRMLLTSEPTLSATTSSDGLCPVSAKCRQIASFVCVSKLMNEVRIKK